MKVAKSTFIISQLIVYLLVAAFLWKNAAQSRQWPAFQNEKKELFDFTVPTSFHPDTANKFILPITSPVFPDTSRQSRGVQLMVFANLFFDNAYADKWKRICWQPGTNWQNDTLWVENDETVFCVTPSILQLNFATTDTTPLPAERSQALKVRTNCTSKDPAERGQEILWQLGLLTRGFWMEHPDIVIWRPYNETDSSRQPTDTLWMEGNLSFEVVNYVQPDVPSDLLTTKAEVEAALKKMFPVDVVESKTSLKTRLFYPKSGKPRPVCLSLLLVTIAFVLLLFLVIRSIVRKNSRTRCQEEQRDEAPSTQKIRELPITMQLHDMAAQAKIPNAAEWMEFEKAIETAEPDFLQRLRPFMPNLSEKEWRTCLLVRARFTPSEMCSLLSCSKQSITNVRARLHAKMFGERASSSAFDKKIKTI